MTKAFHLEKYMIQFSEKFLWTFFIFFNNFSPSFNFCSDFFMTVSIFFKYIFSKKYSFFASVSQLCINLCVSIQPMTTSAGRHMTWGLSRRNVDKSEIHCSLSVQEYTLVILCKNIERTNRGNYEITMWQYQPIVFVMPASRWNPVDERGSQAEANVCEHRAASRKKVNAHEHWTKAQ